MEKGFYTKKITCPVCDSSFDILKVTSSYVRVSKKDEDFCPHYETINPLLYYPCICANCGYAAMEEKFESISDKDIKIIQEKIMPRWVKRDFPQERTINLAIDIYKIVLLNLQARGANHSEVASACMKIGWLYRYLEDPKEEIFLNLALGEYKNAYENESFPTETLDEITCMYIIGELLRRQGNINDAAKWFYKVISCKILDEANKAKNNMIINMARDQLQNIREQRGETE